jgi:hypothetical protein
MYRLYAGLVITVDYELKTLLLNFVAGTTDGQINPPVY